MEANKFVGVCYFAGDVSIDVPPEYFLQRLYDYDNQLVVFPSQVRPNAYVIARRRQHTPGLTYAALGTIVNPDTRTCVTMGWVPVCMMFKTGESWNPDPIIAKLKARDIWEQGGADKVADALEAQEAQEEADRKKAVREDLWNRSGDAWRSYQARTGASSIKFNDNLPTKAPVTETTVSTVSTPRSTAGLGAASAA